MDIRSLVNPVSEAPPRRSPSGSHNILASSPAISSANLPTPPPATNRATMTGKRNRHDPRPIWAYRENETDPDGNTLNKHLDKIQRSRPAPAPAPQPQPRPPPPIVHNGLSHSNGTASRPADSLFTSGYTRPISDDIEVYDDVARKVCDFVWMSVIKNEEVRQALQESPDTQVEVEARWGQIQNRADKQRLQGIHTTECIIHPDIAAASTKFESTMTMPQHRKMNKFLNDQVGKSLSNPLREKIHYKHTKEIDQFFELKQDGFSRLPPTIRGIIGKSPKSARIRVTRAENNPDKIICAIIKLRIDNLEISSPQTEWDYRIGINLEVKYPGPLDDLQPIVESGLTIGDMARHKDRMSYSFTNAFQVDLTQVTQGKKKIHELELELNSDVLLREGNQILTTSQPSQFEYLMVGLMNNLRVLSREITPMPQ
ncbi:mRNA triphosphatase CET1 [Byssothecium circinans]|uniref:mRNA-capping enzyme subunit beta n=1 Tax=Byssothecium circinans TaxID=147558 RepID=A0A6A5U4A1_9PLEO|nr:mRNA triphosphatase CET1 [Byssothecium circinans]